MHLNSTFRAKLKTLVFLTSMLLFNGYIQISPTLAGTPTAYPFLVKVLELLLLMRTPLLIPMIRSLRVSLSIPEGTFTLQMQAWPKQKHSISGGQGLNAVPIKTTTWAVVAAAVGCGAGKPLLYHPCSLKITSKQCHSVCLHASGLWSNFGERHKYNRGCFFSCHGQLRIQVSVYWHLTHG